MTPGSVTAALLLAMTLPAGAIARTAPTDHRRAGTARLRPLPPGFASGPRLRRPKGVLGAVGTGGPAPSLVALPATPQAGERVRLTLLNLPNDLRSVAWQLSGASTGSRQTLGAGQISVVFAQPGIHRVVVQLLGAAASQSRILFVTVAPGSRRPSTLASPAGRPHPHPASTPRHVGPDHLARRRLAPPQLARRHLASQQLARRHLAPPKLARAAGDPAVGIADFHFTPATLTIHVGDTVTWTNSGPSGHTATARDGSFDTGQLSRGQSASHTFTRAGTYAYFCSIHPFMHGTVTVLAATTSPASAASSPNSATTPTTPAPTATAAPGPTLPNTGLPVDEEVGAALALITLGLLARRAVRGRRT